MKHIGKLNTGVATAVLGFAMLSAPAFADEQAPATTDTSSTIVVTGSLIRNPNIKLASPVISTSAAEIELKQGTNAEELLRDVPGLVPDIGSSVNNGNGGASFANLRGLGSNRNLVVLDGDRIVPANLSGVTDLNNIPVALVSRVDVLTGGAVTTYGADAITGVINFVTKKNFTGVELDLGDDITGHNDGNKFRADLTVGGNFADGRGNAVLSVGYQKVEAVYQGDRDYSEYNVGSYSGSGSGSGTAIPSRFSLRTVNPTTGAPHTGTYSIDPTGGGLHSGYTPFNFNPYNLFQTPYERYNMFAKANYEVSDNLEVYARGMFSRNSVETIVAPSGVFGSTVSIPLSNPYMSSTLRNQICSGSLSGVYTAFSPLSQAQCNAAATAASPSSPGYQTWTTVLKRRMPETGTRNSDFVTQMFDMKIGMDGKITSTINWDVHAAYGLSTNTQSETGYVLTDHVQNALNASNTTSCFSGVGCVPLNIFGPEGSISQAMAGYLSSPSTTTIQTSLAQVHGQVSGDFGWKMPAAANPVSFALGTEYRYYHATQQADILAQMPGELGGAGGAAPTINGGYKVWEGFAELVAPLVEDKPFIKLAQIEGGARYSSYKVPGGAGENTWSYKTALTWAPSNGLKFRGSFAHAVRAPNIGELFTPATTGLTNLLTDPCAGSAPSSNANLRAVCLAQGAPSSSIGSIANPSAAQANVTSGGNINVRPETANTFTFGTVVEPVQVPHLSFSLDYYRIKVTNAITSPTATDLINACFGDSSGSGVTSSSASNPACTVIQRNALTGGLDGSSADTPGLYGVLGNLGYLYTSGFDFKADYDHTFGAVRWNVDVTANHTIKQQFQVTPTSDVHECAGYFSASCGSIQPGWQWSVRNSLHYSKFDVSLLWRHLSAINQETLDVTNNGAAYSGALPSGLGSLSGDNVNFGHISAYNYFDFSLRYAMNSRLTFVGTVQNMFNKQPPIVGSTIGSTSFNSGNTYPSTYDTLGRRFAITAKLKF